MKIVILDGYTLNPGDLSWDGMKALGELTVYDRTPAELVVERSKDAEIIYTNKTPLNDTIFSQLPQLKYIGVLATGYNVVDVNAAKSRGIVVTNIPAYGTKSVAQMTFALLLELCHHVQEHSTAVHNGDWVNSRDFCFCNHPLIELSGKTMGIIGFGRIGRQVAEIAYAFGLKVIGCAAHKNPKYIHDNFSWGELDELLGKADIVSLHCPLSPATTGIINKDTIAKMKKSAFLINTSRGQLIDETALAEALNCGIIAGAGIDVLSIEPPRPENPLLSAKNCVITPHIAWATKEARVRLMDIAVQNLKSFLQGQPVNVVNK